MPLLFLILFFLGSVSAYGQDSVEAGAVTQIRVGAYPDHTRIVLDLTRPVSYRVVRPAASDQLSLYLSPAILSERFVEPALPPHLVVEKIEIRESGPKRLHLLLRHKPRDRYRIMPLSDPDRLVIDVYKATPPQEPPKDDSAGSPRFDIQTIAIDPGHGGKDPGAIGARGLTEKEVVLDVSLRLKTLLQKRLKKKVVLTRARDTFVALNERARLANRGGADLFVSIHANASPTPSARGVEVYLFGRATDKTALALAARENAAAHQTALDFEKMILNDMERDFMLNASLEFAHYTQDAFLDGLGAKYETPALGVKHAPFYVLAHTRMPAILAEISFISNPREEALLRDDRYRQEIAEALYKGIADYLKSL